MRAAIAEALYPAHGERVKYAANRWGRNSAATELVEKATLSGLNRSADGGDQLVGDEASVLEFIDVVRAASIIGRVPGWRRVGFHIPTLVVDETPRVVAVGEGQPKPAVPLKVTRVTGLSRFKYAGLYVATQELLRDADIAAEALIMNQLVKGLAAKIDADFLDPANSGSANVKAASITNAAAGDSPAPGENLFEWSDIFTGDPTRAVILLNPFQAARLYGASRPDMRDGGMWGPFKVYLSSAVPDGYMIFVDPEAVIVAMGEAEIRTSQQADIEMEDTPSNASGTTVAQAQMTSMFQTNSTAIIGEVSANWRVIRDNAVVIHDLQGFGLAGGM